jgi:hypothetical protein
MKLDASPLQHRRTVWPLFLILTLVLIIIIPALPEPYRCSEVLIASVGGMWALAFYLHGRHAEDARFMKELLTEFNGRYDKMNSDLQIAVSKEGPFDEPTRLKFVDYFNLCAEEWLFRQAGYIYDPVWLAWWNGMAYYGEDPRVRKLWEEERKTNSYYGFELPRVKK